MLDNQIFKALEIAKVAHKGQVDKGGKDYIFHPVSVALMCNTDKEKIVALLHDVIEDNKNYSVDFFLEQGFGNDIIEALKAITHNKNESYNDYLKRVKTNKLATAVKLNDLYHNSDLSRLKTITDKDKARFKKYQRCINYLKS